MHVKFKMVISGPKYAMPNATTSASIHAKLRKNSKTLMWIRSSNSINNPTWTELCVESGGSRCVWFKTSGKKPACVMPHVNTKTPHCVELCITEGGPRRKRSNTNRLRLAHVTLHKGMAIPGQVQFLSNGVLPKCMRSGVSNKLSTQVTPNTGRSRSVQPRLCKKNATLACARFKATAGKPLQASPNDDINGSNHPMLCNNSKLPIRTWLETAINGSKHATLAASGDTLVQPKLCKEKVLPK